MNKSKIQYETPTLKVVIFKVEAGFADSPYTINQVRQKKTAWLNR